MPPTGLVIDLVSSPEVPLPPPRKPTALPAKALSYGQSTPANHSVIELLSDETDEWPPEEPKLKSDGLFGGSSWSFSALDSTIDQPAPGVKTGNKIYRPNTVREERQSAKGASTSLEKPPKIVKGADDFYFLEDDFDSTVNFDDSIVSHLPSAKKRRLSPSPKVSTKLSTGGYSRSLSNIESNTTAKTTVKGNASASLKRAYSTGRRIDSDPIVFSSSFDPVADAARRKKEKAKMDVDFDSDLDGFPPLTDIPNKPQEHLYTGKEKGKMDQIFTPLSDTTDDDRIVAIEQLQHPLSKQTFARLPSKLVSSKGKPSDFDFDDFSDSDPPDVGTSKPNPKIKSKHQPTKKANKLSSTAADILADYASSDTDQDGIDAGRSKPKSKSRSRVKDSSTEGVLAEYIANRAKESAARAKRDAAAEKKAAKEAEREQKQLEKERKAREKQKEKEIATVNTLRTDKKLTTPEMIVELSSCLEKKLASQTKTFLEDVKATYTEWESTYPIVKWKRKVVAEYDENEDLWKPVPEFIRPEKHVLYVMTAKELVQHVTGESGQDLNTLAALIKSMFESSKIIFLIEGVTAWTRRNRNIKNREYDAAVRSYGPHRPITSQRGKRVEDQYVDEEVVENSLLELQILHSFQIHHTGSMPETAQWIKLFTENISSIPYKKTNLTTGFCMETGQVKTGENTSDTYTKMLQEMVRVTLPVAIGIATEYPTVQQLVKGLERHGPTALEECRKSANSDGAFTNKRVGKAISKRVYDVFLGTDPGSWDV